MCLFVYYSSVSFPGNAISMCVTPPWQSHFQREGLQREALEPAYSGKSGAPLETSSTSSSRAFPSSETVYSRERRS